jgi:hypothetical protein
MIATVQVQYHTDLSMAALIDAVVYAQRDSTTNDVAEIAEREPGCNIANWPSIVKSRESAKGRRNAH